MKKCALCSTEITLKNNAFPGLFSDDEQKRILKLRKDQTVCLECKSICMMLDIISPFQGGIFFLVLRKKVHFRLTINKIDCILYVQLRLRKEVTAMTRIAYKTKRFLVYVQRRGGIKVYDLYDIKKNKRYNSYSCNLEEAKRHADFYTSGQ